MAAALGVFGLLMDEARPKSIIGSSPVGTEGRPRVGVGLY